MLKKLQIVNINKCNYTLLDTDNKQHEISIIFYGFNPRLNDFIYLDESMIKEINIYNFGSINNNKNIKDNEIIKIVRNKEEYYLQRYYG